MIEREESSNEADTCRKYVVPKLVGAGWDNEPHSIMEQRSFTDGCIVVIGDRPKRRKRKRANYLLRHKGLYFVVAILALIGVSTAQTIQDRNLSFRSDGSVSGEGYFDVPSTED